MLPCAPSQQSGHHYTVRRAGAVVVVLALALLSLVGPGGVPARADGPYIPSAPTSCDVRITAGPGGRLEAVVRASAAGNVVVRGWVHVAFRHDGRVTAERTIAYRNGRVTVPGPRMTGPGTYSASMRFDPDNSASARSCRAVSSARGAVLGQDGGQPDGGDPVDDDPVPGAVDGGGEGTAASDGAEAGDTNGLLPGTGGPAAWLLVLALVSLVSGAVVLARRRVAAHHA